MGMRTAILKFIYRFPKGSIWQTRYLILPFLLIVSTLAIVKSPLNLVMGFGYFFAGIFVWTLLEYIIHRWFFHYQPKAELSKAVLDRFHIFHHDDPKDNSQVCLPFVFSLPVWAVILGLILVFGGGQMASLIFVCGFAMMMTIYDIAHYSAHYMPATNKVLKILKYHHMRHHYHNHNKRFGVTTPFWDYIFRTMD